MKGKVKYYTVLSILLMGYLIYALIAVNSDYRKLAANDAFWALEATSVELFHLVEAYESGDLTPALLEESYSHMDDYRGILSKSPLFNDALVMGRIVVRQDYAELDHRRIESYENLYRFIDENFAALRGMGGDSYRNIYRLLSDEEFCHSFELLIVEANEDYLTGAGMTEDVQGHQKEASDESELTKLRMQLDILREENIDLNSAYEELKEANETHDRINGVEWFLAEDISIKTYSGGGKTLEDGIVYVMEGYDQVGAIAWVKVWEEIHVSDLACFSPLTVTGKAVYVVVDGDLYGLDLYTGKTIMAVKNVGQSFAAPLVYANGDVVVIGQYQPHITYIDKVGNVLWQKTEEDYAGTWDIEFNGAVIEIMCDHGKVAFDRQGNVLLSQAHAHELYRKAKELYGWFDLGSMPMNSLDRFNENGRSYNKVTGPITNYHVLLAELRSVFDEDVVQKLIETDMYTEKEGELYGLAFDRGTDLYIGKDTGYGMEMINAEHFLFQVTAEYYQENGQVEGYSTYDFPLVRYEDGKWRFERFYLFR